MPVATLVIAIGVAEYESRVFTPLPGARKDVSAVREHLIGNGLPASNFRVIGESAAPTRRACLNAMRVWTRGRAPAIFDLFVFFSGHGLIVGEADGVTSVLATSDTDPSDPIGSGLKLEDFADAIFAAGPRNAFVFIDACEVGGAIEHLPTDLGVLSSMASDTSFAMVAAPGGAAVEHRGGFEGGIFTTQVLAALHPDWSCARIGEEVASDLLSIGGPEPHIVLTGDPLCRPMGSLDGPVIGVRVASEDTVLRVAACEDLIEGLQRDRCVWLWGESGIGKSFLARQMRLHAAAQVVVVSVPPPTTDHEMTIPEIRERIGSAIAGQCPESFPSGQAPIDGLLAVLGALPPDSTLVVDQLDSLSKDEQFVLAAMVVGSTRANVLFVGKQPAPPGLSVEAHRAPLLTDEEVGAFIRRYGNDRQLADVQLLAVLCERNPLKLRTLLASGPVDAEDWLRTSLSTEEERTLNSVLAAQGFTDVELFCSTTDVPTDVTYRLIDRGLIQFVDGRYACHDSVRALGLADNPGVLMRGLAYWCREHPEAVSSLAIAHTIVGLVTEVGPTKPFLEIADGVVSDLHQAREWESLNALARCLTQPDIDRSAAWGHASVAVLTPLVRAARQDPAGTLLTALREARNGLDLIDSRAMAVLKSEMLWWFGDFDAAQEVLEPLFTGTSAEPAAVLSRGIALWFTGKWEAADANFEQVLQMEPDLRTIGWAKIMLASSLGLRGLQLSRVETLFREGATILRRAGDDLGMAVAWGNLGEIRWKHGDFESAGVLLRRALYLADAAGAPQIALEISRSVLECAVREHGPWSLRTEEALTDVDARFEETMGPTVTMQLWNTLATLQLLKGDVDAARNLVAELVSITRNNHEYNIYTMFNKGYLALLDGDLGTARADIAGAFRECEVTGNQLAVQQLKGTVDLAMATSAVRTPDQRRVLLEASSPAAGKDRHA